MFIHRMRLRIRELRKERKLTQEQLAEAAGISRSYIAELESGKKPPNLNRIRQIAKVLKVPVESLISEQDNPVTSIDGALVLDEVEFVNVWDVSASAGYGAFVDYEPQTHNLAFPREYLRKLTSSQAKNLSIISVKGDSMEPTLLDDDIVLLDMSKRKLSYDGLFVLRYDDTLHVKRIGRSSAKDHITIISDNRSLYPAFEALTSSVEAVGKVLWYGRKV